MFGLCHCLYWIPVIQSVASKVCWNSSGWFEWKEVSYINIFRNFNFYGFTARSSRTPRPSESLSNEIFTHSPVVGLCAATQSIYMPSVRCRRFAACKRSLELRGCRILDEICRNISRPRRVPSSAARGLFLAENVGTSKGGGKAMATYP